MFVRLPDFGRYGVIQDTVSQALPVGAWSNARNMRFTGIELQKMLEPTKRIDVDSSTLGAPLWFQLWADGLSTYVAMATADTNGNDYLYFWRDNGLTGGGRWIQAGGPYSQVGQWQSFAWGDTCIFNNGVDDPQIFNPGTLMFENLPNWGVISTADDILNNRPPSKVVSAQCRLILPYKDHLLALGYTESGVYQPTGVWWSNSTNLIGYDGVPDWDYESPASLSGKVSLDPESGAIRTAAQLNENMVIYTDSSATALTKVGGRLVMQVRRLFNKGAAGLHCVAEFNNQHYVVARDQLYVTDGSTVALIAKDRVEEEFFTRVGKGGRYGSGDVDWTKVQVVKNPDRKEIVIVYQSEAAAPIDPPSGIPDFKDVVDAQLLYAEPDLPPTMTGSEAVLGVYKNFILANVGTSKMIYSANRGQSWQEVGPVPGYNDDYRVNKIVYNRFSGYWYIKVEDAPDRQVRIFRSANNGASWTRMEDDDINQFTSTALIIDAEGRLVSAGRDQVSGLVKVRRWNDPDNDTIAGDSYAIPDTINRNIDNLQENGNFYVVSVARSGTQDIYQVPKTMDADLRYLADLNVFDYIPWTGPWERPSDSRIYNFIFRDLDETGGISNFDQFYIGSAVPLGTVGVDYTFDIRQSRIAVAPGYHSFSVFDVADGSVQVHSIFDDPDQPAAKEVTLNLPTTSESNSRSNFYHSDGNYFIGHYVNGNRIHIYGFSYTDEPVSIAKREALVYNFEDDNYTWMDAAVIKDGELSGVACMQYGFDPGWQARWDDFTAEGVTWQDFSVGSDPWSQLAGRPATWADFYQSGSEENLYWLAIDGIYLSDQVIDTSGVKQYFIERLRIDFDDVVAEWKTNSYKYAKQLFFHLQSPSDAVNPNNFQFEVGASNNLMDDPSWRTPIIVNLQKTASNGRHKVDFRATGRYLSLRMDFSLTAEIAMTSSDIDVEEAHGR